MIVKYVEDKELSESIIDIKAKPNDIEVHKIIRSIDGVHQKLIAYKGDRQYLVDYASILYIESLENRLFIYVENDELEMRGRLYELESDLPNCFMRISKSCIVNLLMVNSIIPDSGSRLILELMNQEKVIVNRSFVKEFKRKLNMR